MDLSDSCVLAAGEVLWLNGTILAVENQKGPCCSSAGDSMPNAPFPYQRLGCAFIPNATQTHVYHQLNGSTLAQEIWDEKSGAWLPSTLISIATT